MLFDIAKFTYMQSANGAYYFMASLRELGIEAPPDSLQIALNDTRVIGMVRRGLSDIDCHDQAHYEIAGLPHTADLHLFG